MSARRSSVWFGVGMTVLLLAGAGWRGDPGIGTPVRDGKFEFVVQKVECGPTHLGDDMFGEKAQGRFCLVTLSVKNIGKKAQTMSDSAQKAKGDNGAEYSANSMAGIAANGITNDLWLKDINPGNQVTGLIVFDVPADVKLTELELHDSIFSGGVKVKL